MAASPATPGSGMLIGASALERAVAAVGTALAVAGQMEPNAMERRAMLGHTFRLDAKNPASPLPAVAG